MPAQYNMLSDVRSFMKSRIILTATELDLFTGGDTYTFAEIKDGLKTAGFEKVKMVMQGERMDCLVEARKR